MVLFQKTKLSHRLIIMAGFFLFFILLVSVISVFFMKKTANDEWNTYEFRLVPVQVLNDAAIEMGQHFRRAYSYIHPSGSVTEAESRQNTRTLNQKSEMVIQKAVDYLQSTHDGEYKAQVQQVMTNWPAYKASMQRVYTLCDENKINEALQEIAQNTDRLQSSVRNPLRELVKQYNASVRDAMYESAHLVDMTALILAVLTGTVFCAGCVLSMLIFFSVTRQLGGEPAQVQVLAATIAAGDLTTPVTLRRNDTTSLLASLDGMQANLRSLVSQIKDTASSVALAADEIAQGNTELSSRTEEQAAALQETAASMEQLTATVKSNTAGAQQTAESARETARTVDGDKEKVHLMTQTMHSIQESALKVRDITSVIESIAFQTNILALNAAVEAARAVEEGRGFAVVAGEVRTLAQRSATAAKDIKVLIEQAVAQVESGVEVATGTGQSILKIVGMVGELAESMDVLALASSEQMQGISQVSVAVSQMDGVTQNNAALVEESSSASRSLSEQAHALRGMVEAFRV
ncbi:methyl-accepting chemotaxis protein [Pantoea ananatis]|uniref:methyl-accepting chemotaxis protein n=1 Tax=Pantoea ananas TaxID=553 RepID=UPI001F4F0981|nr:methyl-accepting chemotaxis protein [Pantoea ananatis]MCH9271881.1 methyl-accepting chemotaxis protein [Pantoea ananatis]